MMTASIGMAICESGADTDAGGLIRDADAAVYRAKEQGRGWIEVHDESAREQLVRRVELEQDLREALDDRRFAPLYQPVVDLAGDGSAVGWEALARWPHPGAG